MGNYRLSCQNRTDRTPSSFFSYTIERNPPIPPEQQSELIKKAQHGDSNAMDALYLASLRGAMNEVNEATAHYFSNGAPFGWEFDDLLDESFLSFQKAVIKYDTSKANGGTVYSFFSRYQFRADVQKYIGGMSGMKCPDYRKVCVTRFNARKHDADGDETGETELDSLPSKDSFSNPETTCINKSLRRDLAAFFDTCTEEERQVARMRLGWDDGEEKSFDTIGSRLGTNKGRAFYVFSNVCKRIKESGNFRDYVE